MESKTRRLAVVAVLAQAVVAALPAFADAAVAKGSGVEVTAQVAAVPGPSAAPAGAVRVVLRLSGITDMRGAGLRYTVSGPGHLLNQDATPLPPGAPSIREVRVGLDAPSGPVYLNVFTSQRGRTGVVSVPLREAPFAAQPQAKARPGADGRLLLVLPAQLR